MTREEVVELIEKEKENIREKVEHNKKLFESGETNIKLYNKDVMREIDQRTKYIDPCLSIEETIEMLSDFLEENKVHENKPAFRSFIDEDGYNDISGRANWYEPLELSEEEIEHRALTVVKETIRVHLGPPDVYKRYIDCTLFTLFMDGTIDWSALQKLVYSDCRV